MNSKKWPLHYDFATQILGYNRGPNFFNLTQYQNNRDRQYILGSLNYYSGIDTYVIHYVSATELTCTQLETVSKQLADSFIKESTIRLYPSEVSWKNCEKIDQITSEALYQGQLYQGLNLGANYGYLRKLSADSIEKATISRRELILTDGIPNDLPVVAGIITSVPQTPLSHINVLSHNRGTPNMSLKDAWDNDSLNALTGQLVYLKVAENHFELRTADLSEAEAFWDAHEPQNQIVLTPDFISDELVDIYTATYADINRIGAKAAQFGELTQISSLPIPTPENAFAIPFYYYHQHLITYGIDTLIRNILSEDAFYSNTIYKQAQLEKIQQAILDNPVQFDLITQIENRVHHFTDFDAYRFRSSTNAEDLEFFSGAGLYDSYSAKKGHATKTIENAIRKVWASLWNYRAFEEREYFNIDHEATAMGILVHRSFPNEDANGVLITKNLYNQNPGFIINVQYGEESIVFPQPGVLHDQIILFTWSVDPTEEFMIEYLSFSNVAALQGKTVMTDAELEQLGRYAKAIKRHFYSTIPNSCHCSYENFGVDIEFKVDSDVSPRKIYIKQARLYQ